MKLIYNVLIAGLIVLNMLILAQATQVAIPLKMVDYKNGVTQILMQKHRISSDWAETILYASARYRVDPIYLAKLYKSESNFNPFALSSKGYGNIAQTKGGRDDDPEDNMYKGARILRQKLKATNNDLLKATAMYKGGLNPLAYKQALQVMK